MGVKTNPSPIYGVHGANDVIEKVRLDGATNALISITQAHHEVHEGELFEVRSFNEIPINEFLDLQIVTPDSAEWIHFLGQFDNENEVNWWFYEDVTIVTPGTPITAYNCNRNSPNSTSVTVAYIANANVGAANADTAIASASTLFSGVSGSGREGGQQSRNEELILKQNTAYSLRFEAVAAGYVNYAFLWYGHTHKDIS